MPKINKAEQEEVVRAIKWDSNENPVRNTKQDYLRFVNTRLFSSEAMYFLRHSTYCSAPFGSKDYDDYWNEQEKRCLEGYSVGGVRITGRHYFYLNFGRIRAVPFNFETGQIAGARKVESFPRFLDMDYYLFHELEECFAEGVHLNKNLQGFITLKSRRKGFSYKMANGVYAYNYNFFPDSFNVLAAFEKGHYEETLNMIWMTINHINKNTDWTKKRSVLDKRDNFRASFKVKDEQGNEYEDGYKSEIIAITFKDNPFRSIGRSTFMFGFEEFGRMPNGLATYTFSEPTWRDGDIFTGVPLIWGSAADMKEGSRDMYKMFYDPKSYGLKAYENIYDENTIGDCGWFIDDLWYFLGSKKKGETNNISEEDLLVDKDGNSMRSEAKVVLLEKRAVRLKGDKTSYNQMLSQQPLTPSEAFVAGESNRFDVQRAEARLRQILTEKGKYVDSIYYADLQINTQTGEVEYKTVDPSKVKPVWDFPLKDNIDKIGNIEIYEMPKRNNDGLINYGRYCGGADSYDADTSTTTSVGSLLILDTWTDRIVCHYKGRPKADVFFENCRRILKFYNAQAAYERFNLGIYTYFSNKGCLHLLADEPSILAEKGISSVGTANNRKGIAPSDKVNNLGLDLFERYLSQTAYGEEAGSERTNYDIIRSVPLLKELIHYSDRDGFNADSISSALMLMILRESRFKTIEQTKEVVKNHAQDQFWDRWKMPRCYGANSGWQ